MVKFSPTALTFGYDFVLIVHSFWDNLYIHFLMSFRLSLVWPTCALISRDARPLDLWQCWLYFCQRASNQLWTCGSIVESSKFQYQSSQRTQPAKFYSLSKFLTKETRFVFKHCQRHNGPRHIVFKLYWVFKQIKELQNLGETSA